MFRQYVFYEKNSNRHFINVGLSISYTTSTQFRISSRNKNSISLLIWLCPTGNSYAL